MKKLAMNILRSRSHVSKKSQVLYSTFSPQEEPALNTGALSEKSAFLSVFPSLVEDISNDPTIKDIHPFISEHISSLLNYTTVGGKLNRGMAVPSTYLSIVQASSISSLDTSKTLQQAKVLGWTVELLQAFFLVADDIMDESVTRRGQPCWYKKQGVGLGAFNDSLILETCVYSLLRTHFRSEPYYLDLLESMIEVIKFTTYGQSLDTVSAHNFNIIKGLPSSLDSFDMERYTAIVKYKTSYYSFYLPVVLAMHMAGIKDPELFDGAKTILLEIGHYFQVTDDYLDCFGDPAVTGKIGTDIQDGKCSWLVVKALEKASTQEKNVLALHYGSTNIEDVERIKNLYRKLEIDVLYKAYEENFYRDVMVHIERICSGNALPKEVFVNFLEKVYQREK